MSLSSTSMPDIASSYPLGEGEEHERQRIYPRHAIEPAELTLTRTFFPMGYPVEVRTNEAEVFTILNRMWGHFEPLQGERSALLRFDIHVVEGKGGPACPPATVYRLIRPLLMGVADSDNYSVVDLETLHAQVSIARTALAYPMYAEWFLFSAPLVCISTRLATPIHGACVGRRGRGVLLCGESGAGKSTLAYACARAGWTFTSDDATMVRHHESGRHVIGNCHQVRFRPAAMELFPELAGREITPRAAGKPSVEVSTAELPGIHTAFSAEVQHIVFLDRRGGGQPLLEAFPVSVARSYLRETLFGLPETLAVQYEVLERMLGAPIYRLRYERLDDAIALLERLVDEDEARP
jgi:hypothetical protein